MASLDVRLQPGASRDQIGALREGVLTVRVTAPPLDGRANQAVTKLLAKHLRVAPSRLSLVSGGHSRNKRFEVDGLTQAELNALLGHSA